jgi:hypothetical protein
MMFFFDHFADYCHSFRHISDAITRPECIVSWIGLDEREVQPIWRSRFVKLQPRDYGGQVEARNESDGADNCAFTASFSPLEQI